MADRRNEIADSIRQRIVSGLHLGALAPGARLPSTREIAADSGVAPRTVMSAYRLLEAEGLVELRERSGIYVAPGSGSGNGILTHLASWVVDVLVEARARELPPVAFPERVRRCVETLRLRAACIAGNHDQMEQVCQELQEDYGIESDGVQADKLIDPDADTERALRAADLLVGTALYATQVQHVARRLGKPAIIVALRREVMTEVTRQLAEGPVYLIASDPRFRDAMRMVFDPDGNGANLRVRIIGEDDVEGVPVNAPTYIMARAHRLLGDAPIAGRVSPIRRIFSKEMARELLTFVVRANIAAMAARPA